MKDNIDNPNQVESLANIQKTAATIVDLADNSNVGYANQIKLALEKRFPGIKSFAPSMSEIVVSRYLTSQEMLEEAVQNTDGQVQIIELGSGFTPHALNLNGRAVKYIEIDLPDNISLKKEIVGEINQQDKTEYISGSILDPEVWDQVYKIIDRDLPVIIFSVGLIIYFSSPEQDSLTSLALPLIKPDGVSRFVFDDSLKYHPELQSHPALVQGRKNIISTSKNQNMAEDFSQEEVVNNCKARGFTEVKRHPYIPGGDKLKEITDQYKLFECFR
jgi:O-methyltransferase involved in polyketide biosynthesis